MISDPFPTKLPNFSWYTKARGKTRKCGHVLAMTEHVCPWRGRAAAQRRAIAASFPETRERLGVGPGACDVD